MFVIANMTDDKPTLFYQGMGEWSLKWSFIEEEGIIYDDMLDAVYVWMDLQEYMRKYYSG